MNQSRSSASRFCVNSVPSTESRDFTPPPPPVARTWAVRVDTAAPAPDDIRAVINDCRQDSCG